ncbi:hypothetical protein CROQUDRAFT_695762, partial [Cronartium quercuum f. sp. fusiforme G11]
MMINGSLWNIPKCLLLKPYRRILLTSAQIELNFQVVICIVILPLNYLTVQVLLPPKPPSNLLVI